MSFLLDTNVVSEWTKPKRDEHVRAWLGAVEEDRLFLSVASLAELRDGVERLPPGARRRAFDAWLAEELPRRFEGRILGVDAGVADAWGRVMARGRAVGRPMGTMDALIAATAERYDLALVTRNVRDFSAIGLQIVDPWHQGSAPPPG
ncbi:MAG: type II toxin-antitoxin system VapC family toxin [Alphaproteobacteria bacterium]|nr:type II toxin-antitoxin system VapC family toxin [Alphaproteobacteria bacterium]